MPAIGIEMKLGLRDRCTVCGKGSGVIHMHNLEADDLICTSMDGYEDFSLEGYPERPCCIACLSLDKLPLHINHPWIFGECKDILKDRLK